jgi:hypothetical protein
MSTDDHPTERPGCGLALYLGPLVMLGVVLALYAQLAWYGWSGRPPDGPEQLLVLQACPAAQAPLQRRLEAMGFPARLEALPDGFQVRVQASPEQLPQVMAALSEGGQAEVRGHDQRRLVGPEGFAGGRVRLDLMMSAVTVLDLRPEALLALQEYQRTTKDGLLRLILDGQEVAAFPSRSLLTDPEIELRPEAPDDAARMELAARRAVALADPLPCPAVAALAP